MDLRTALIAAIEFEREVRDHYAQCARDTADPRGQRVFAALAREEQGHAAYLENCLTDWSASGRIQEGELPSALPPVAWIREAAGKIAHSTLAPAGAAGSANLPELEFLNQALALEYRTQAFYQELVEDLIPAHRVLFIRFLDIEDGHVTLVQAEIDALMGHGQWFDFTDLGPET
jgi:rubrerythrin